MTRAVTGAKAVFELVPVIVIVYVPAGVTTGGGGGGDPPPPQPMKKNTNAKAHTQIVSHGNLRVLRCLAPIPDKATKASTAREAANLPNPAWGRKTAV